MNNEDTVVPKRVGIIEGMGTAVWLLAASEVHYRWSAANIVRILEPPLKLNQAQFYFRGARAIGLVTWAFFDEKTGIEFGTGQRLLAEADWRSGENLWMIDFVAPFGGVKEITNDLTERVWVDIGKLSAVRRNRRGEIVRSVCVNWRNKSAGASRFLH